VKLNLVPQERRFYELFSAQGVLVSDALTELSKSMPGKNETRSRLRTRPPRHQPPC
jgi:hypothetical protein